MFSPSVNALIDDIFKFLKAKIGFLFPSPNGSNTCKLFTSSTDKSSTFSTLSINKTGYNVSTSLSFAIFSKF